MVTTKVLGVVFVVIDPMVSVSHLFMSMCVMSSYLYGTIFCVLPIGMLVVFYVFLEVEF